jgi:hypothetical protein
MTGMSMGDGSCWALRMTQKPKGKKKKKKGKNSGRRPGSPSTDLAAVADEDEDKELATGGVEEEDEAVTPSETPNADISQATETDMVRRFR